MSNTPKRLIAGFAAMALAVVGITAATVAPAQAATKSVHVTAAVDGGSAMVGTPSTVNFTISNASQLDDFHKFTIVVPPGATSVQPLGVSGGGYWSLSVAPCGTVPNCSALVVGKAGLPKSSSRVRPGTNLVASISLVATAAGTLTFQVIRVEDDAFQVLDSPSITVKNGVAGSFCVKDTSIAPITAGDMHTFTVQAIAIGTDAGGACTGLRTSYSGPKTVRLHLLSDDGVGAPRILAVPAAAGSGDGTAVFLGQNQAPVSTKNANPGASASDVNFTFPPSTTGQFKFTVQFFAAADPQSLDVAEASPSTVDGNSGNFTVNPGPATSIVLTSVTDTLSPAATTLTAGSSFDANFYAQDAYGNATYLAGNQAFLNTGGYGKLVQLGASSKSTPTLPGVVSGTYDTAANGVPLYLTAPALLSPTSNTLTADFAGAGSFCVTKSAGDAVAGTVQTFTAQAILLGTESAVSGPCGGTPTGYVGTKTANVSIGLPDAGATFAAGTPVNLGDGTVTANSDGTFNLSSSSTGAFTFTATFTKATLGQTFSVAEVSPGQVAGTSGPFAVTAGPAANIILDSVADHATPSKGTSLTAGAQFDAGYHVTDAFDNPTTVDASRVTLKVDGPGTFTQLLPTIASPAVPGVISGSYSAAGKQLPISLSLADQSLLVPIATSNAIYADFAAASVGTGVFVPGGAGSIQSLNFAPLNPDGTPNCSLDANNPACASANLPNGANGTVTLFLESCQLAGVSVGACLPGTSGVGNVVAHLTANLKDNSGGSLYSAAHPASLTYVCSAVRCPWNKHSDDDAKGNGWENAYEAYKNFPLYAEDASNPGVLYKVPACQTDNFDEGHSVLPATTVPGPQKSCVDVTTIKRNLTTGDIAFGILWYDDYKIIPGG